MVAGDFARQAAACRPRDRMRLRPLRSARWREDRAGDTRRARAFASAARRCATSAAEQCRARQFRFLRALAVMVARLLRHQFRRVVQEAMRRRQQSRLCRPWLVAAERARLSRRLRRAGPVSQRAGADARRVPGRRPRALRMAEARHMHRQAGRGLFWRRAPGAPVDPHSRCFRRSHRAAELRARRYLAGVQPGQPAIPRRHGGCGLHARRAAGGALLHRQGFERVPALPGGGGAILPRAADRRAALALTQ